MPAPIACNRLTVTGNDETLRFTLDNPNAAGYRLSSDNHGGTRVYSLILLMFRRWGLLFEL